MRAWKAFNERTEIIEHTSRPTIEMTIFISENPLHLTLTHRHKNGWCLGSKFAAFMATIGAELGDVVTLKPVDNPDKERLYANFTLRKKKQEEEKQDTTTHLRSLANACEYQQQVTIEAKRRFKEYLDEINRIKIEDDTEKLQYSETKALLSDLEIDRNILWRFLLTHAHLKPYQRRISAHIVTATVPENSRVHLTEVLTTNRSDILVLPFAKERASSSQDEVVKKQQIEHLYAMIPEAPHDQMKIFCEFFEKLLPDQRVYYIDFFSDFQNTSLELFNFVYSFVSRSTQATPGKHPK